MRKFFIFFLLATTLSLPVAANDYNPDPWEGFNRKMFAFNETMDSWILRPTAEGYKKVTTKPIRASLSNFFSNVGEVKTIISDVFQLKMTQAASDTGRFITNTTLGFFGFFDVATHIGMKKHNEDFGQVLGYWGVKSGPYIMWPFLGPSTVRDTAGFAIEFSSNTSLLSMSDSKTINYSLSGLYGVNVRAELLDMEGMIQGDRYTFIRSFYLQNREYLIKDGKMDDDFGDEDWDEWE